MEDEEAERQERLKEYVRQAEEVENAQFNQPSETQSSEEKDVPGADQNPIEMTQQEKSTEGLLKETYTPENDESKEEENTPPGLPEAATESARTRQPQRRGKFKSLTPAESDAMNQMLAKFD